MQPRQVVLILLLTVGMIQPLHCKNLGNPDTLQKSHPKFSLLSQNTSKFGFYQFLCLGAGSSSVEVISSSGPGGNQITKEVEIGGLGGALQSTLAYKSHLLSFITGSASDFFWVMGTDYTPYSNISYSGLTIGEALRKENVLLSSTFGFVFLSSGYSYYTGPDLEQAYVGYHGNRFVYNSNFALHLYNYFGAGGNLVVIANGKHPVTFVTVSLVVGYWNKMKFK